MIKLIKKLFQQRNNLPKHILGFWYNIGVHSVTGDYRNYKLQVFDHEHKYIKPSVGLETTLIVGGEPKAIYKITKMHSSGINRDWLYNTDHITVDLKFVSLI